MDKAFSDLQEFHALTGQTRSSPTIPEYGVGDHELLSRMAVQLHEMSELLKRRGSEPCLRARLIVEETAETIAAMNKGDIVGVADGIVDVLYVTVGMAVQFGIPLPKVWDAVHEANMAKFPSCETCDGCGQLQRDGMPPIDCDNCHGLGRVVLRDAGGKVMKPSGWRPADVLGIIAEASAPELGLDLELEAGQ